VKYISAGVFASFMLLALGAELIAPYDPWVRFEPLERPSQAHPLGTNDLGNDILSEFIYAARVSIATGLGAAVIACALGITLGMCAAWYAGIVGEIIMTMADVFLLVPRIPLILCIGVFFSPSYRLVILILGLLWWPSIARVVRAKTRQVKNSPFVLVNISLGFPERRILFSDLFPHIKGVVIPQFLLTAASAMLSENSLAFLGLGDNSIKSWGTMIQWAFSRGGFINGLWWWLLPPGAGIFLLVFSLFSLEASITAAAEVINLDA
jgi:peptide/nickel transport system permease protein